MGETQGGGGTTLSHELADRKQGSPTTPQEQRLASPPGWSRFIGPMNSHPMSFLTLAQDRVAGESLIGQGPSLAKPWQ